MSNCQNLTRKGPCVLVVLLMFILGGCQTADDEILRALIQEMETFSPIANDSVFTSDNCDQFPDYTHLANGESLAEREQEACWQAFRALQEQYPDLTTEQPIRNDYRPIQTLIDTYNADPAWAFSIQWAYARNSGKVIVDHPAEYASLQNETRGFERVRTIVTYSSGQSSTYIINGKNPDTANWQPVYSIWCNPKQGGGFTEIFFVEDINLILYLTPSCQVGLSRE